MVPKLSMHGTSRSIVSFLFYMRKFSDAFKAYFEAGHVLPHMFIFDSFSHNLAKRWDRTKHLMILLKKEDSKQRCQTKTHLRSKCANFTFIKRASLVVVEEFGHGVRGMRILAIH